MLTITSRFKKRNGKGSKVVIPLLSGLLFIGSLGSATQNAADNMTTGSEKTLNCVCSVEPKDYSALLDQQTCGPQHPKKGDDGDLSYKEGFEKLSREMLKTSSST